MGIPPTRFRQYPHEFSGGMRQRIMIALALVLRPKLLVADEPTTSLDVIVEAQILAILADLKRNFGTALLLITHNLGIVAEACDRVAVMYAGKIVEDGPARDVFAEPAHPYTRELLRSTISLETTELHSIPGAPPNLIDPPAGCRFHPRCPDAMRVCGHKQPVDALDQRRRGPAVARAAAAVPTGRVPGCTGRRPRSRRARPPSSSAAEARRMQTKPEPLVSVRDLRTYYSIRGSFLDRLRRPRGRSVRAVNDVSFDLHKGEVLGLVGESGSGKTTLGRTLLGLVRATGGSVEFEGRDITKLSERELRAHRRRMQIVFQDPHASLNPAMTIGQAVGHPLEIHGLVRRAATQCGGASPRRSRSSASPRRSSSSTSTRPTSRAARSSGR